MKGNRIIVSSAELFNKLSQLNLSGTCRDSCHLITRNDQLVVISQSLVESIDIGYEVSDQEFQSNEQQLFRLMEVSRNILEQPILLKFKDSEIYIKAIV